MAAVKGPCNGEACQKLSYIWPHLVLSITSVALFIIAAVATTGQLNAIGVNNALYLSYAMYAGGTVFALAEIALVSYLLCQACQDSNELELDFHLEQPKTAKERVEDYLRSFFDHQYAAATQLDQAQEEKEALRTYINERIAQSGFSDNTDEFMSDWKASLLRREKTDSFKPTDYEYFAYNFINAGRSTLIT